MALRALTSPTKDESGMHTPAKNADSSFEGENVINSLRKRLASTALRPKTTSHFAKRLDDNELSMSTIALDTSEAIGHHSSGDEKEVSESHPIPQQRASALWLEEVISGAASLAEHLKQQRHELEVMQTIPADDFSSLGILSQTAMGNSFEKSDAFSSSYNALMNIKERQNQDVSSETCSVKEVDVGETEKSDNTLVESNASSNASVNFSNIQVDNSPFLSTQHELGFDSKDFMSADADGSAINQLLEKDQLEAKEPIPSPYRIDFNEFSGIVGEGDIDIRKSWLSPEKRNLTPNRLSIGQYFASKCSTMKDLIHSIRPGSDSIKLDSPSVVQSSPLPTGPRPEFMTAGKSSETITVSDEEEGNNTITLDQTTEDVADDSVQCLDGTLVPGRDSLMSLSVIKGLLESNKGVNTLTEQLFETAQHSKSKSVGNPSPSTSRETFLISPNPNPSASPSTPKAAAIAAPSRIPKLRKSNSISTQTSSNTANKPGPSSTSRKINKTTPVKPKRRSPGRANNYKSPLSKQTTTPVKSVVKNHSQDNFPAFFEASKPLIKLPLQIDDAIKNESTFQGIANVPMHFTVPVNNISKTAIECSLVCGITKYLDIEVERTVTIQAGAVENLHVTATALISGPYFLTLELLVKCGSKKVSYPVDPLKLNIEAPKVRIFNTNDGTVDFGLCPENTRKFLSFTVKNLSSSSVSLNLKLEQCSEGPCFYFLVPTDSQEIDMVGAIALELPGSGQIGETNTHEIYLLFVAPKLENMRANKTGEDAIMKMKANIIVTLDIPKDKIVLDTCTVCGKVGRTQLLVSETDHILHANTPCLLRIRNAGVVPLDLQMIATHEENSNIEPKILIEPAKLMANPGEDYTIKLMWNPNPGEEFNTVNRELHLNYDGIISDNIVSLKCCPPLTETSVSQVPKFSPLPVRSTRTQLSWGALSPGLTAQQFISFKNISEEVLYLQINIVGKDQAGLDQEPPFKVLSEAKEVTRQVEFRIRPNQDCKVTVMFCPQRPGPASACMRLSSKHPVQCASKNLLLTGYGGQSLVILRRIAHSQGRSWLSLNPGLGDHVDGNFHLVNTGSSPAFVYISSSLSGGPACNMVVKPDRMMLGAHGTEVVSVRLLRVSGILSKAQSGEIKTLGCLNVNWINEVTRKRLHRLVAGLSGSEKAVLMRLEHATALMEIMDAHVEGEEDLVSSSEFVGLKDFSLASAMSLSKDLVCSQVELRAEGTGANNVRANETDTMSPFVSLMDATMPNMSQLSLNESSAHQIQWTISTKEVSLYAGNKYCTALQVCNMSATESICLETEVRDELLVTPSVTQVLPCQTVNFHLQLKRTPLQSSHWPAAVRVYSKNDVAEVSVRVFAVNSARVARTHMANMSLRSAGSSHSIQEWMSLAKVTNTSSRPLPEPLNLEALPQLREAVSSASSSSCSSYTSAASSTASNAVYLDTTSVTFPWTQVSSSSILKITFYNNTNTDKKVNVLSVRSPFSIETHQFVISGGWHKSINIKFSPHIAGKCSEILTLAVEGQTELLKTTLQGHAISK